MWINKNKILPSICFLLMLFVCVGTIAYFRRTVNGDITGNAGNLVLIVNEADAVKNETFTVVLQRSEEEPFVMPDDKGTFDINIDSTGSTSDVAITITLSRINLPDNLKFYLDEDYKNELTTKAYVIKKSDDMTKTVPIYWFWDGSKDDINDSLFINQTLSANVDVSASIAKNLRSVLFSGEPLLDTDIDFSQGSSSTNGEGVMIQDGTQNDEYPILYYRGNVAINNVKYLGFCWLIVRTTETGGIKLLYNGKVNDDGSCNNYSNVTATTEYTSDYSGAYIDNKTGAYNALYNSPVYIGYMYNDTSTYFTGSGRTGTLDVNGYATHLSDNSVDQETGRHTQNLKDSTVKSVLDDWYEKNIKGKIDDGFLEDTVWCNDRGITSSYYPLENYASIKTVIFSAATRIGIEKLLNSSITPTIEPTLTCQRDVDKFTVSSSNGNGDLTYPIGLLTADEALLAGGVIYNGTPVITYLSVPSHYYWTMSPVDFGIGYADLFYVDYGGLFPNRADVVGLGIRPVISVSVDTIIIDGNGTFTEPFHIG